MVNDYDFKEARENLNRAKKEAEKSIKEENLKMKLGILAWSEIDNEEKLLEFILHTKNLDHDLHVEFLKNIPHVIDLNKNLLDNITEVTKYKKETTEKYIEILRDISNHLGNFLNKEDISKEERLKAMEYLNKSMDTIRQMNESDTNFFDKVIKFLGYTTIVVGAAYIGGKTLNNKNSNKDQF